ncbi:MAG TPA: long-chain fatty acid--CoA ligase [Vicinamibacterales bacterium]|nr:long-chain fatty acid--CoA ligase [Vicinamibacterales bacterium]
MATEPSPDDDVAGLPPTIARLPFFVSGRYPKPDLLGRCEGDRIVSTSGRELIERVREIGLGLQDLGMQAGHRVGLLSESRPDWLFVDFAILAGGAVTVPIYPTLATEQVAYILRDSEATMAIVSTAAQLEKVLTSARSLPALKVLVGQYLSAEEIASARGRAGSLTVMTLTDVAERGHQMMRQGWGLAKAFQDRANAVQPSDLATIIYTSGTTSEPKGVMLTHGNLAANLDGVTKVFRVNQSDTALSFLPLCHGFERMVAYTYLASGVSMIFAESIDTIPRNLRMVRPSVMSGVPRVYEKLRAKVTATATGEGGLKKTIFEWASRVAEKRGAVLPEGGRPSPWLGVQSALADRLVFRTIREGLGGRFRFAVSGSAPLGESLGRWFYGIGIPIVEGYGLTETSPVLTVIPLSKMRIGTVGPPLPGVEVKIAEDGEILARGPNIMQGYYRRPEDTRAALQNGWFHTGDIGELDAHGYLKITDRKKELIVTSGGKKIAPQPIESELRSHPLIAEAVLLGDKRHFPTALIVPDFAALMARLGVPRPPDDAAMRTLLDRADVRELFSQAVEGLNAKQAQFERIKKFHLLANELTLEAGELTPTLKVKRRVIEVKYHAEIDALYS